MKVTEFGKGNRNTVLLRHGELSLARPELYAQILTDLIGGTL